MLLQGKPAKYSHLCFTFIPFPSIKQCPGILLGEPGSKLPTDISVGIRCCSSVTKRAKNCCGKSGGMKLITPRRC